MSNILVIDDEPGIREIFQDILKDEGYEVFTAADGLKGLNVLQSEIIDLVFLDIWLPGMGGIEVLQRIREEFPNIEVVVISGHANVELAVKAIKLGAYDILEKPIGIDRILHLCRHILELEDLRRENKSLKAQLGSDQEMIGKSEKIQEITAIIRQAAGSDATVLITGENGTGKELVAREIHAQSSRRQQAFIPVNCAAIPENLIESELFGHEKGAFTGAVGRKRVSLSLPRGGLFFSMRLPILRFLPRQKSCGQSRKCALSGWGARRRYRWICVSWLPLTRTCRPWLQVESFGKICITDFTWFPFMFHL